MKELHLEIITPENTVFEGEIESVQLPGSMGLFEVLVNHAPLISSLDKGKIRVRTKDKKETFFDVKEGFVEVLDNKVIVLV